MPGKFVSFCGIFTIFPHLVDKIDKISNFLKKYFERLFQRKVATSQQPFASGGHHRRRGRFSRQNQHNQRRPFCSQVQVRLRRCLRGGGGWKTRAHIESNLANTIKAGTNTGLRVSPTPMRTFVRVVLVGELVRGEYFFG